MLISLTSKHALLLCWACISFLPAGRAHEGVVAAMAVLATHLLTAEPDIA